MISKVIHLGKPRKGLATVLREANTESAKVWNFCKDKLQEAMRDHKPWPTMASLCKDSKGKFNLNAQSVQQVCRAFVACVNTTRTNRKEHPELRFRYPNKDKEFYPILWPNQAAISKDGVLSLSMGRGKDPIRLKVGLPDGEYACRIVWHNGYELHICQEAKPETQVESSNVVAAIDLGEIHQIACVASNGNALLVSGRGIRTIKHLNSKMLGKTQHIKMGCKKGSRRFGKITRSRAKQSSRNSRRIKDLRHKGTRQAIDFLVENKVGKMFVGNPDGIRNKNSGKQHNQRMSLWEYGKDIQYLKEKSKRVGIEMLTGLERGTSSTCPACGARRRQKGRQWICVKCGFRGHRDLVGATNMHLLAFGVPMVCPERATYLRPSLTRLGSSRRADTPHGTYGLHTSKKVPCSLTTKLTISPPTLRSGSFGNRIKVASIHQETHPL